MKVIYKYEIPRKTGANPIRVIMPPEAKVLKVLIQTASMMLWAIVDMDIVSSGVEVERKFTVLSTGQEVNSAYMDCLEYIDTVFAGQLVWHVFEYKG